MRSWIFVLGAAAMGVASVFGFYIATARASQQVERIAASSSAADERKIAQAARYYAQFSSASPASPLRRREAAAPLSCSSAPDFHARK